MGITSRDFIYSVILHVGLLLTITMLNPFTLNMVSDFDSVAVNIISMPPLGNPDLIKGSMPEIAIPEATIEDLAVIPISKPESKTELKPVEKKEESPKPKRDTGYKGDAKKDEASKAGGTDVSDQVGAGTEFGSVIVDNADFQYPFYFVQAFRKIRDNWSNPVASNQLLSCTIYFKVIRSGTILGPVIEKPSGVKAYDDACLRALQGSISLPPLPADFRDDIIGIHLEFQHNQ